MRRLTAIAALAFTLAACSSSGGNTDGGAFLACREFNDSGRDYVDQAITFDEMRDKMKGIESSASLSEAPGIASNAREMLVTATAGDAVAFEAAGVRFVEACSMLDD